MGRSHCWSQNCSIPKLLCVIWILFAVRNIWCPRRESTSPLPTLPVLPTPWGTVLLSLRPPGYGTEMLTPYGSFPFLIVKLFDSQATMCYTDFVCGEKYLVPQEGIEPPLSVPKTDVLSVELPGQRDRCNVRIRGPCVRANDFLEGRGSYEWCKWQGGWSNQLGKIEGIKRYNRWVSVCQEP